MAAKQGGRQWGVPDTRRGPSEVSAKKWVVRGSQYRGRMGHQCQEEGCKGQPVQGTDGASEPRSGAASTGNGWDG